VETITIARAKFREPNFRGALTKLSECPNLETKVAYNLMILLRKIDQSSHEVANGWKDLISDVAARDEKGDLKVDLEAGEFVWKDGVDAATAKTRLVEYGASKVDTGRNKFTLVDLDGAALSAVELGALSDIYLEM